MSRRSSNKPLVVIVIVVALAAASGSSKHHNPVTAVLDAISDRSSYTPSSWATAFLHAAGYQASGCNRGAVEAWEAQEGNSAAGHDGWHNPLNTTYDGPGGSWLYNGKVAATENSAGVRAYDTWHTGLVATVRTLDLPAYAGIRSALAAGDSAQAVADAEADSPWGTGPLTANCL